MSYETGQRLAVLGSPIQHSLSPKLHQAAYAVLGLAWRYEAVEMTGDRLAGFLERCDEEWRGLSLTMPLKRDVIPLLDEKDDLVGLTGVANTVLITDGRRRGFNTDVRGIVDAFRWHGVNSMSSIEILGGGATAISALVAARTLGATRALFRLRTPHESGALKRVGDDIGVEVDFGPLCGVLDHPAMGIPNAVISTLPGHADVSIVYPDEIRSTAVLLDVAYDPWPSRLASAWSEVNGRVVPGTEMLIQQALAQIRIFVNGTADAALPRESKTLAAMREAIRTNVRS